MTTHHLLTEAPSDIVRRLTTRLATLRAESHHLLVVDAYLRGCRITDYTTRVRTRITDIRHEATGISRDLHRLGHDGLAREALQNWPIATRAPKRPTRTFRRTR